MKKGSSVFRFAVVGMMIAVLAISVPTTSVADTGSPVSTESSVADVEGAGVLAWITCAACVVLYGSAAASGGVAGVIAAFSASPALAGACLGACVDAIGGS